MEQYLKQISNYIDERRDEMVDLWKDVVNIESCTREKENVDLVAERFKTEFEKAGLKCELVDVGPNSGKALLGIIGEDRPGKPAIFSGHMDTVFAKGTFGENPFRIEDGKAYGPGVLDMKGGIIISLYVIKALNSINYNERPIKIVYVGDEEKGHQQSTGAEFIMKETSGGICAFNMETGLIDNSLCIGRKGASICKVTVDGVESHAGNDFTSGRNSIAEMAHKIIEIQKLTNLEEGTTVSATLIKGGTVHNAIPAQCKLDIDIRYKKMSERNRVKECLEQICAKTYIEGTSTKMEFGELMAAYETTEEVLKFYDFVKETSKEYGFGEPGCKQLGGSSDASYIGIVKTPVICSFGVRGEWNHTAKEYALVESLFERVKLISTIIMNLGKFNH